MIVLYPNEQILFQKEAKITLRVKLKPGKIEGKGMLYITNMRIVFEDYKQGILTQFAFNEMHGYRKVKGLLGEKLSVDYQRSHSNDVLLAELEFKGVDDAYKLLSMLTGNSSTNSIAIVTNNLQHYNMMTNKRNNIQIDELDGTPEWVKPWVKDIKFTWDPRVRTKELELIGDGCNTAWEYFKFYLYKIERDFEIYAGTIDVNKFANDFKFKVAREATKMRADFPFDRYYTYDSNRYWLGIIPHAYKDGKDELVGINLNAEDGSGYFICSPQFWYHKFLSVVGADYDYKKDGPFESLLDRSEETKSKLLLLAKYGKEFFFAVLNKDFKTAEIAYQKISETYKKYETENFWLMTIGQYGLILKYAIEMDKYNIPIPTPTKIKRSPI